MAGSEKNGYENSRDDLFNNASVIITPTKFNLKEDIKKIMKTYEKKWILENYRKINPLMVLIIILMNFEIQSNDELLNNSLLENKTREEIQNLTNIIRKATVIFGQEDEEFIKLYETYCKISQIIYQQLQDTPLTRKKPPKEGAGGRFFIEELTSEERMAILEEFTSKLDEILSFILKGEGEFGADWILITMKPNDELLFYLEPIFIENLL